MKEKCKEVDMETHFKDAFRAFSKDKEGSHCPLDHCVQYYSFINWFILIEVLIRNHQIFEDKNHAHSN